MGSACALSAIVPTSWEFSARMRVQTCDGRISHPRAMSTPCSDPDSPSSPCVQASVSRRSLVVNAKDGKTVVVGLAADSGGYSQQEQL